MIQALSEWLVYGLIGLSNATDTGQAVHFFVYETVKIGLLLVIVTHVMTMITAYFPVERVRTLIASGTLRGGEHLAASLFGALTPFCSCSSIPLFVGFLQAGIPLGVTLSFLITSPLVNEVALALFIGLFGWKVTLVYGASGILLGTLLGWGLGKVDLGQFVKEWVLDLSTSKQTTAHPTPRSFRKQLPHVSREAMDIVTGIAPYVVVGLAVGAAIHGYVPTGFLETYLSDGNSLAVPLSVALAVPMYAGASSVLPIVQALVAKGVPLGTALAFMMAVVGLSLPEALMLKKVMQTRLLATFFGSVAASIVVLGYLFNWIL